jgi:hypothetical protein
MLNEVSSDDHVWRRFCHARWSSDDKGSEGKRWKGRYMAWLQPRLKQYATSKGNFSTACHLMRSIAYGPVHLSPARGFAGPTASARPSPPQSADYDQLFKFNVIGDAGTLHYGLFDGAVCVNAWG